MSRSAATSAIERTGVATARARSSSISAQSVSKRSSLAAYSSAVISAWSLKPGPAVVGSAKHSSSSHVHMRQSSTIEGSLSCMSWVSHAVDRADLHRRRQARERVDEVVERSAVPAQRVRAGLILEDHVESDRDILEGAELGPLHQFPESIDLSLE